MSDGTSRAVDGDPLGGTTAEEAQVLREVLAALRSLHHGTVSLIVQDRRVVQIDRTEKRRLAS
jgi:hypothetical protein